MRILILALLMGLVCCVYAQPSAKKLRRQIDKMLVYETDLQRKTATDLTMGIVIGDSTYFFVFRSKNSHNQPIHQSSQFEIGGLTKVLTAALAYSLNGKQGFHIDSSQNSYLPKDYQNELFAGLSVRDLLTYKAELPLVPSLFGHKTNNYNNPYAHYSKKDLLAYYRDAKPLQHSTYYYSHTSYALLEVAIEYHFQTAFNDLLDKFVLNPLQMEHTYFISTNIDTSSNRIVGYSIGNRATDYGQFQSFSASHGGVSCVEDWLKLLKMSMHTNCDSQLCNNLHAICKQEQPTGRSEGTYAASGWHIWRSPKDEKYVVQAGHNSGFRCFTGFQADRKVAMVLFSNSGHALQGIGFEILMMLENK